MNKILVLTDFSDVSRMAGHYAMQLAVTVNAELHFLHVINTPPDLSILSGKYKVSSLHIRRQEEEAERKLDELTKEVQLIGLPSRYHVAYDHPCLDFTDQVNTMCYYDFSIMGACGEAGMKKLLTGSDAQKVIRQSGCPVLVIKKIPKKLIPEQIVFVSVFKRCDQNAFLKLLRLAHIFGAEIKLLYVKDPSRKESFLEVETRIWDLFQKVMRKPLEYYIEMDKQGEEGVLEYIEKNNPDLIAISTEGKTRLSGMAKPTFAESLVNHAPIPVLSILKHE